MLWTVVLEKTLESHLDRKEIQPVNPKSNQSWVFIGRTDAEAETPILWPPDAKSWLIGKDPDAGRDWGQEEMTGWEGWMASPAGWTWVWVSSGSWWWTGKPGMLQSMGSQKFGYDWVTELKANGKQQITADTYQVLTRHYSKDFMFITHLIFTTCKVRAIFTPILQTKC